MTAPVFWFYLYWLPPFLNQQYNLGINVTQMGIPLIIIYLTADFGSVGGDSVVVPDRPRHESDQGATAVDVPVRLLHHRRDHGGRFQPPVGRRAAISLAIGAHQAWTANIWSLVMDYTPKHMMSTVFGFGGMCAAIGGMFMTQIVGHILTVTNNNYTVLFTLIPAMYFIALTWMYFMAPRKIPTVDV
jgi:ACS family hexuronate transporter-like MFS transporter